MQNGHGGEVDIERVPNVAHYVTEQPTAEDDDTCVEAHGHQSHQNVGHGQRYHEIISDDAQLAEAEHADDDQQVAENGRCDDETH